MLRFRLLFALMLALPAGSFAAPPAGTDDTARAAEAGNAMSMERLGHRYLNGYGVERDVAKAVALFQRSAALGYDPAKLQLAWCLETGTGVAVDAARALALYEQGAARQDRFARKQLVLMYQEGRGGPAAADRPHPPRPPRWWLRWWTTATPPAWVNWPCSTSSASSATGRKRHSMPHSSWNRAASRHRD